MQYHMLCNAVAIHSQVVTDAVSNKLQHQLGYVLEHNEEKCYCQGEGKLKDGANGPPNLCVYVWMCMCAVCAYMCIKFDHICVCVCVHVRMCVFKLCACVKAFSVFCIGAIYKV